jgi:hypothetical protein
VGKPNAESINHPLLRRVLVALPLLLATAAHAQFWQSKPMAEGDSPRGSSTHRGTLLNPASGLCLDLRSISNRDGNNVQLGSCSNNTASWELIDLGGSEFAIVNRGNGRVVDVSGGSFSDGANVQLYGWNNSGAQRWRLEAVGGGRYKVVNQSSGKCLDIEGKSGTPGANVQQWSCHGGSNQQWQLGGSGSSGNRWPTAVIGEPIRPSAPSRPGGALEGRIIYSGMIVSRKSGKCIDVARAQTTDGANIQQWTCNGTNAQLWDFYDLGGGDVAVALRLSRKVMDVNSNSSADGANIAQYSWHGRENQRWRLEPAGRGFFKLVSVGSGKCIDVDQSVEDGRNDGANVQQWSCHGKENQQWRVEVQGSGSGWSAWQAPNVMSGGGFADVAAGDVVGNWEGTNPLNRAKLRLSIYADGNALAIVDDALRVNGYLRRGQLYLGAERYELLRDRRTLRATQVGNTGNVIVFRQVR